MVAGPSTRALLAIDDAETRRSLRASLERDRYSVDEARSAEELFEEVRRFSPDIVMLDTSLSPSHGLDVCRRLRHWIDVPVVLWGSASDASQICEALDLYAEDYIRNTSSNLEVCARIRHVLRHSALSCPREAFSTRVDDVELNLAYREVRGPAGVQRLTPLECRLLEMLVVNSGQVVPTEVLLERVWGDRTTPTQSLWEHVRRVRRKLGDDSSNPRYILCHAGLGYSFAGPRGGSGGPST